MNKLVRYLGKLKYAYMGNGLTVLYQFEIDKEPEIIAHISSNRTISWRDYDVIFNIRKAISFTAKYTNSKHFENKPEIEYLITGVDKDGHRIRSTNSNEGIDSYTTSLSKCVKGNVWELIPDFNTFIRRKKLLRKINQILN